MNSRPNQKADLYLEIKYFYHCKIKPIEPEHTCTRREWATNLKMSLRDVSRNLKELQDEEKIIKEIIQSPKSKAWNREKYTVVDRKMFESKDLINEMNDVIDGHLDRMREVAKKMRDRPSVKSIKKTKYGYTGKRDEIGERYLDQYCDIVKEILERINALDLATFDDSIESNDKNLKIITNLKRKTLSEIDDVLEYTCKPYSTNVKTAVFESIIMRIPTFFHLTQIKKRSKLTI